MISGDFEATFEALGTSSPFFGVEDANGNRTRYYIDIDDLKYYKISRSNGVFTAQKSTDGTTWTTITANQSNVTSADCYFLFLNNGLILHLYFICRKYIAKKRLLWYDYPRKAEVLKTAVFLPAKPKIL